MVFVGMTWRWRWRWRWRWSVPCGKEKLSIVGKTEKVRVRRKREIEFEGGGHILVSFLPCILSSLFFGLLTSFMSQANMLDFFSVLPFSSLPLPPFSTKMPLF